MAKVLISGRFNINLSWVHIAVLVLILAAALSTIFSLNRYGSFWGWPSSTTESLLTLIGLVLVYFLISNAFSRKEVYVSTVLLAASATISILVGVLQLFGIFLPFSFAKSAAFNTIGLVGSLGMFAAALLPLLIILEIYSGRWPKILAAIAMALDVILFVLINYPAIWWAVLAGCALLMLFSIFNKGLLAAKWLVLPMFFLVLSLFFLTLNP